MDIIFMPNFRFRSYIIVLLLFVIASPIFAQQDSIPVVDTSAAGKAAAADTSVKKPSKFDRFNQKMERLFKIIPVPIVTYSTETGNVFGLAKFNLITLSKKFDSTTKPSKLSEVLTFSTKGDINASVTSELVFNKNKYIILSYINYKKEPEFFYGIGNDIDPDVYEKTEYSRFRFNSSHLFLVSKNFYLGPGIDLAYYYDIKLDSNSYLINNNVTGLKGGFTLGLGIAAAYDSRVNRYNPDGGAYIIGLINSHPTFLGSAYKYTKFDLDARKYFNPWYKHVIALQATTSYAWGEVPFYDLPMMGGDNKMRGYYQGAYRDKVLVDAQVEYRMPVWNIFGITAWVGTGRVADSYGDLSLDGFKISYGGGIRIRVDTKNNTNLRLDFGFGQYGFKGTYINFAEAF